MSYVGGTLDADLNKILEGIDVLITSEQADGHPDGRDTPVRDERSSPIMSPSVVPREETRPTVPSSSDSLSPLPPIPHQSTSIHQRTKKQSGVGKVWNKLKKLKKLFAMKFGGDQQRPKLSDKLVPERDDEVKWHEPLFSKPPKSAKTRK